MSQHNIIGSEAFDRKPFVLVRSYRLGGHRRRRAGTTLAYIVVAAIALLIGAVVVALFLGPQLADAQVRGDQAVAAAAPLSAPAVPGTSSTTAPADGAVAAAATDTAATPAT